MIYQLALIPVLVLFLVWGAYSKGRSDEAHEQRAATAVTNAGIEAFNTATTDADTAAALNRDRLARAAMDALQEDLRREARSAARNEAGAAAVTDAARTVAPQPADGRRLPAPAGAQVFSPVYRFSEQELARFNAIK